MFNELNENAIPITRRNACVAELTRVLSKRRRAEHARQKIIGLKWDALVTDASAQRWGNAVCIVYQTQWRIQTEREGQGAMSPQTHVLLKKIIVRVAVVVRYARALRSVLALAMIRPKFVTYLPPGKIMFSAVFCRNSSAFDRATVSLECQTEQAYWRAGPGHITAQKQILRWLGECIKTRTSTPKNEKHFWEGTLPCDASILAPLGQYLPPARNSNPGTAPEYS